MECSFVINFIFFTISAVPNFERYGIHACKFSGRIFVNFRKCVQLNGCPSVIILLAAHIVSLAQYSFKLSMFSTTSALHRGNDSIRFDGSSKSLSMVETVTLRGRTPQVDYLLC